MKCRRQTCSLQLSLKLLANGIVLGLHNQFIQKLLRILNLSVVGRSDSRLHTCSSAILFSCASSPPSDNGSAVTRASNCKSNFGITLKFEEIHVVEIEYLEMLHILDLVNDIPV